MDAQMIVIAMLMALLLMAAWQDIRNYRIKNILVMSGAVIGIGLHTFFSTGLDGFDALLGWVTGLCGLLPLYMLRTMGAGDVKLMAMVGAFLGPQATLVALLYVLVTGGVLSIVVALLRGGFGKMFASMQILMYEFFSNLVTPSAKRTVPLAESLAVSSRIGNASVRMPYGVAIAAGTVLFLVARH